MAGEQSYAPQDRLSDLPVIEQSLFPAERSRHALDFESKNALARALTPEYANLNPDDYADITYGMVEYVTPTKFAPHLIDVPRPTRDDSQPNVISYYAGRSQGEIYIAVTPEEAKLIPRGVGAIRRAARIATAAKVTTAYPTDQDLAREERSGQHVHEQKLEVLRAFRDNVYMPQGELLDKFIEASQGRHFGLARFGSEAGMRQAMATLQTQIFGDMIRAYGRQRHLGETMTKQVERALTVSFYFDRQNNQHLTNFAKFVRFAKVYNGHKTAAVNQRIESIERQLS